MNLYCKRTIVFLLCILFLFSCGDTKLDTFRNEVKSIAAGINSEVSKLEGVGKDLDQTIERIFSSKLESIDISKMDESSGGNFKTFQEKVYVSKYDAKVDEVSMIFLGAVPLTEYIKKAMFLLYKEVGEEQKKYVNDNKYISRISIQAPKNCLQTYPGIDLVSVFPVGFDYEVMEFFPIYKSAKREPLWIPPVISVGPEGWIHGLGSSLDYNGTFLGTYGIEITPLVLINDFIKNSKEKIIVMFADTTVIGATASAKEVLKGLQVISEVDYVEQLKNNPEAPKELKLNYEKHDNDIKALASLIKKDNHNKDDLSASVNGVKYRIYMDSVPISGYIVLGLF